MHQGVTSRSLLGAESQPLAFVNGTIGSPRLRRVVLRDARRRRFLVAGLHQEQRRR
jgi:hypothetical protein